MVWLQDFEITCTQEFNKLVKLSCKKGADSSLGKSTMYMEEERLEGTL